MDDAYRSDSPSDGNPTIRRRSLLVHIVYKTFLVTRDARLPPTTRTVLKSALTVPVYIGSFFSSELVMNSIRHELQSLGLPDLFLSKENWQFWRRNKDADGDWWDLAEVSESWPFVPLQVAEESDAVGDTTSGTAYVLLMSNSRGPLPAEKPVLKNLLWAAGHHRLLSPLVNRRFKNEYATLIHREFFNDEGKKVLKIDNTTTKVPAPDSTKNGLHMEVKRNERQWTVDDDLQCQLHSLDLEEG